MVTNLPEVLLVAWDRYEEVVSEVVADLEETEVKECCH